MTEPRKLSLPIAVDYTIDVWAKLITSDGGGHIDISCRPDPKSEHLARIKAAALAHAADVTGAPIGDLKIDGTRGYIIKVKPKNGKKFPNPV